jgi:hypothetical protein
MKPGSPVQYSLDIKNINDVVETFSSRTTDFYSGPYKILSELEEKVSKMKHPEEVVLIPYKDDGDVIFEFVEIKKDRFGRELIAVYEFASTIS